MITAEWNDTNWKARFFTIWGGQTISLFGSRLVQFALIWWLTQETGSATVLAIASLIGLLTTVILGPFIGALVDRWKRRQVILIVDTAFEVLERAFTGHPCQQRPRSWFPMSSSPASRA
jgi:DHA3 family macrolide efflux protein-like MFS transporter